MMSCVNHIYQHIGTVMFTLDAISCDYTSRSNLSAQFTLDVIRVRLI
jgi:hypothetical protein